jgi:hypothetical protein
MKNYAKKHFPNCTIIINNFNFMIMFSIFLMKIAFNQDKKILE